MEGVFRRQTWINSLGGLFSIVSKSGGAGEGRSGGEGRGASDESKEAKGEFHFEFFLTDLKIV
jgi:hypothetical protein